MTTKINEPQKVDITEEEKKEEIKEKRLTKNQRIMSWISFIILIFFVVFVIYTELTGKEVKSNNLDLIKDLSTVFMFIVLSYIAAPIIDKIPFKK